MSNPQRTTGRPQRVLSDEAKRQLMDAPAGMAQEVSPDRGTPQEQPTTPAEPAAPAQPKASARSTKATATVSAIPTPHPVIGGRRRRSGKADVHNYLLPCPQELWNILDANAAERNQPTGHYIIALLAAAVDWTPKAP